MPINEFFIVVAVALVAWWLVRSIANLRGEDVGRNDRLDVEAAAVLLVLCCAGVAFSGNGVIQIAGVVALFAGLGAGYVRVRRNGS
ncbi:hypothetical protein [Demequina aurantiaca]|uniref:hypothetical protein n=1 Tax=Demequina aurantiaca TaxID=676200 RepID=UPI003D3399A2